MTEKQIKSYNRVINFIKEKTRFEKQIVNVNDLNEKEYLWYKLSQKMYVITTPNTEIFFDNEAKEQGFTKLLNKIYMFPAYKISEILYDDYNIISDWFLDNLVKEDELQVAWQSIGCHVSHCMASEDFLETDNKRILVFEDDCKFNDVLSDNFLKSLTDEIEQRNLGFIHLGWEVEKDHLDENWKLHKINSHFDMIHSYLINRNEAQKFVNTLDVTTEISQIKDTSKEAIKEYIFRSQADDYFTYFVESYCLEKSLTFQQYMFKNKEQGFRHIPSTANLPLSLRIPNSKFM